ncbi:unnamed protein product [Danaus chrysippus]|uniref:(African queen) hypothetical protein n=1 Tax=Danaus chrysippus TaxID=151541 RepID=A0A8J2QCL5_9NEOP|nr:unnamed protein product [Danaus chrysippus]CAG9559837.1 unnamed protein product [Danaus chrysippus]
MQCFSQSNERPVQVEPLQHASVVRGVRQKYNNSMHLVSGNETDIISCILLSRVLHYLLSRKSGMRALSLGTADVLVAQSALTHVTAFMGVFKSDNTHVCVGCHVSEGLNMWATCTRGASPHWRSNVTHDPPEYDPHTRRVLLYMCVCYPSTKLYVTGVVFSHTFKDKYDNCRKYQERKEYEEFNKGLARAGHSYFKVCTHEAWSHRPMGRDQLTQDTHQGPVP